MHPALFQLLVPTSELRRVSPDLRSDRYGDAVRRADVGGRLALPRAAMFRRLSPSLPTAGRPVRTAAAH